MIELMASRARGDAIELSLGEWAVLGLLVTSPAHGFALAKELRADGRWGRIWTVPRPLVYRALPTLEASGLISMDRAEASRLGPLVWRLITSGPAFSPLDVSCEVSSTYETSAAPWLSIPTCR